MKIVWTQTAIDRVSEIYGYIQSDSPLSAQKWVDSVLQKISQLNGFPKMGPKVPETSSENLRELIFGNYRIIYKLSKDVIYLMTVRHFKQILPLEEVEK